MQDGRAARGIVVARGGVAAASQPLAVSAALAILAQGGTCADAAIAASAVLAVVEPYASHLGGDAFVIYYDAGARATTAFNGSGTAPALACAGAFPDGIPDRGPSAASVPGLVDLWFALHERFGSFPVETLLAPAISYAGEGFPAGYRYSRVFATAAASPGDPWVARALPVLGGGTPTPRPGERVVQPDLARTMAEVAHGGRAAFYEGPVAERIEAFCKANGGLMGREDLAAHRTEVQEPLRVDYRGFTVHGQPPVSQGVILLEELNLVERFALAEMHPGSADAVHVMVEAKKLAFADRYANLGDPRCVAVPIAELLSKENAARRACRIDMSRAGPSALAADGGRDTTYFCVVDGRGNAISFIQSVFWAFGSGAVVDGTGILLNNRMTGFSMDPASPNALAPGKRPVHTLNAYVVTRGDELAWVGGTPGGNVQVQSNLQVLCNVIDFGMDPQRAVEAPRWQHADEGGATGVLEMEDRFDPGVVAELRRRGHDVRAIGPWSHGSSYQLVWRDRETGSYHAGSDPRCDGHAAGF